VRDDLPHVPDEARLAVVEPHGLIAEVRGESHRVGHEGDRRAPLPQPIEVVEALPLELLVTHRDDLVDDEDLRVEVHRDREAEPHVHSGGVDLDRRVDERTDVRELDDLLDGGIDLALPHPEDRPVEVDVLAAREFAVEAGTELEKGRDASVHQQAAGARPVDPRQDLQHRRLPGAVVADEAEGGPALDVEAHVVKCLEERRTSRAAPDEPLLDGVAALVLQGEHLGHLVSPDRDLAHSCSPRSAPFRLYTHDAHPSARIVQATTLTHERASPGTKS